MKNTLNVIRSFSLVMVAMLCHITVLSETVGVFYNSNVEQIKFAVGDVKTALESKGFQVEVLDLSKLKSNYKNKKNIISIESDKKVMKLLKAQGNCFWKTTLRKILLRSLEHTCLRHRW